jgi:poly(3-hydroxyalkanoate) depolymerase
MNLTMLQPERPRTFGEDNYLTIRGQRIRVNVSAGVGVPLVMCNGIGAALEVLDPLVDWIEPDIPVVRFDVPGTGESPNSRSPYGFGYLAWLLERVLDELGIGRADILGLSWGGALAQQFAASNRHRCRRVVLVSTTTGMTMVPARPRVWWKMATPRRFVDPLYAAEIAADIYGGSARSNPQIVAELFGRQPRAGSARGYVHQVLALAGWTSLRALWAIKQPTLILAGQDDPILPVINARIVHALLPHSILHIHRGGHVDVLTDAPRFGPLISEFLTS